MRNHTVRTGMLVAVLLAGAPALAADIQNFAKGSLIIPQEATFQTGCGSLSAYGLVWRLLNENGPTGAFGGSPLTIYWTINPDKTSPNRCVPSNKHTPPAPQTGWNDPAWNDGCDFKIVNTGKQPVVRVDFSTTWPTTNEYPTGPIINYATTTAVARPAFAAATLDNAGTFTTIQYMGGPFVIAAADAQRVIQFIRTGLTTYTNGNAASTCSCSAFSASVAAACHYIEIHQATIAFDAPVNKRINKLPPKIALLDLATDGSNVSTGILTTYLASAGLNFTGAAGCPSGTTSGCSLNGGLPGQIYDQFDTISDLKSTVANPKGLLNKKDAFGKPIYKIFWTPHWEVANATPPTVTSMASAARAAVSGSNIYACTTVRNNFRNAAQAKVLTYPSIAAVMADIPGIEAATAAATCIGVCGGGNPTAATCTTYKNNAVASIAPAMTTAYSPPAIDALTNIANFADVPGSGIFAECAALETLEGSKDGTTIVQRPTINTAFQFTEQLEINRLSTSSWNGRNCTDPDYTAAAGACTAYPNPADPFSQVGDFNYTGTGGHVSDYNPRVAVAPAPASEMKTGVKRLAVSWTGYTAADWNSIAVPPYSYPGGDKGRDFFSLSQKDNDINKATIVYFAGHKYNDSIAGTRIVLNTLLNLGSNPIASDRGIAAPVAFDDSNGSLVAGSQALLFNSTYKAVSGTLLTGQVDYDPINGSRWRFPHIEGDLRAHSIVGGAELLAGENALNDAIFLSAEAALPLPADRNLFTYVGGKVTTSPTMVGTNRAPHGVLQQGWVPIKIHESEVVVPTCAGTNCTSPASGCVDVVQYPYGSVNAKDHGANVFGLVPGADGICDLQQLVNYGPLGPDSSFHLTGADINAIQAQAPKVKQLMSLVRGFCYATSTGVDTTGTAILAPLDAQCNDSDQGNIAHFGGAVHSSPAVVGPSPHGADRDVDGHRRPTVAYVGGYDGMLHAVFVSQDPSGLTYKGIPSGALHYPPVNVDATGAFVHDYAAEFAGGTIPPKGTELWAFMPGSQMPFLKGNNARVDSTPVVQDVFADFDGSGVREWHTILVMTIGPTGREIFAFDVTNPLKPLLLWDLIGSRYNVANFPDYTSGMMTEDDTGGTSFVFKWDENTASYLFPPLADSGRLATGLYNYTDLGGSNGVNIAQMRRGLEPVYAAIVSTNWGDATRSPSKGIEVFAIDVATGQKMWQWEQPYVDVTRSSDNTVPASVTLRDNVEGAIDRLFVGDMEGRIWELSALTGLNRNVALATAPTSCTGNCSLPAFDTQGTVTAPQPITTNIAMAKVPPLATLDFAALPGETIFMFGTAGADWVPATVGGQLHVAVTSDSRRKPYVNGGVKLDGSPWTQVAALASAQGATVGEYGGVFQEPANWPRLFTAPERVYGYITVAGRTAFVPTAIGQLNDIMAVSASLAGKTYTVDIGAATAPVALAQFTKANFGGVAVYQEAGGTVNVMASEVSKIAKIAIPPPGAPTDKDARNTPSLSTNAGVTYKLKTWVRRFMSQ